MRNVWKLLWVIVLWWYFLLANTLSSLAGILSSRALCNPWHYISLGILFSPTSILSSLALWPHWHCVSGGAPSPFVLNLPWLVLCLHRLLLCLHWHSRFPMNSPSTVLFCCLFDSSYPYISSLCTKKCENWRTKKENDEAREGEWVVGDGRLALWVSWGNTEELRRRNRKQRRINIKHKCVYHSIFFTHYTLSIYNLCILALIISA